MEAVAKSLRLVNYKDQAQFLQMHHPSSGLISASVIWIFLGLPRHMLPKWAPSPLAWYQAGKGLYELPPAGPAAERGRALEGAVLWHFREKKGMEAQRIHAYCKHPRLDWSYCSPDYLAGFPNHDPDPWEVKCPVKLAPWAGFDPGMPPVYTLCQCLWQGECLEWDRIGCGALFVDQYSMRMPCVEIRTDTQQAKRTIMALRIGAEKFLERFHKGLPPLADDSASSFDVARRIGTFDDKKTVKLKGPKYDKMLLDWQEAKLKAAAAKKAEEEAKFAFTRLAGTGNFGSLETESGYVNFKRNKAGALNITPKLKEGVFANDTSDE